jgi:hypothetical protein
MRDRIVSLNSSLVLVLGQVCGFEQSLLGRTTEVVEYLIVVHWGVSR